MALWTQRGGRKYDVYRPHVQCGLEYGAILREPSAWLDNSSKHKFRYLSNLKTFSASKDFQTKYCKRLEEVSRTLDIDVEDLQEKPEVIFDEKGGFSSTFYEGFIPEFCGTSIESTSNKNTIKSRHKGLLDLNYDPINIIRSYYIMREILEVDLDLNLNLVKMIGRISAVDLILTLNILYDLTDENLDKGVRKEKVISAALHFDSKIVDNLVIWQLSLPQCFNILLEMGFTRQEVDRLLLEKCDIHLLSDVCCRVLDYENMESFIDVMKKRKHLLSLEGVKLGIGDITDTYNFLMNWDKVLTSLDAANIGESPCFVKFSNRSIKIGTLPHARVNTSAARTFLIQYFGYNSKIDREKIKAFDKIFKRVPNAKDVPLKIVVESVQYLEDMKFSFEQIEKGFPIVFYDKEILEKKMEDAANAMGETWMEKEAALCTLNYLIEVESNFSFTLIYTGILKNFQRGLSLQQFQDLKGNDTENSFLGKRLR